MKEIKSIVSAYKEIDSHKVKCALATVVQVEGSSYRRTGARMLVLDTGTWIGGISGGCLEGDALKKARLAIAKAKPSLVTYDTTQDDEHQIGVGLGCNGIIKVLFTPIDPNDAANPVAILSHCVAKNRERHIVLTIIGIDGNFNKVEIGRTIVYNRKTDLKIFEDSTLEEALESTINAYAEKGRSRPKAFELTDGSTIEIFIEIIPPQITLVLMGHQYDTLPLTRLIKEIGWHSILIAHKQKLLPELVKLADEIIPPTEFEELQIDKHTAIILMSHDYKTDKANLQKALLTQVDYIGMLGPRVRAEKIFAELAQEGLMISESDKKRIYAPVGLDIGAISPEEIALSIVTEIRAIFSERAATSLRIRTTPIHERE